jgi:hypothetical protein
MRKDYRPSPDIFIPEFPVRCSGSFCHQRNIIPAANFRLCPECRAAKRRHSYNERGRWKDRQRINLRRRINRYHRMMEWISRNGRMAGRTNTPGMKVLQIIKRLISLNY